MIFLLFPVGVATSRLEPRPHAFFAKERVYMESPGNEAALIYDFALILLKPAIILVSVNKKTARSWV